MVFTLNSLSAHTFLIQPIFNHEEWNHHSAVFAHNRRETPANTPLYRGQPVESRGAHTRTRARACTHMHAHPHTHTEQWANSISQRNEAILGLPWTALHGSSPIMAAAVCRRGALSARRELFDPPLNTGADSAARCLITQPFCVCSPKECPRMKIS